MVILYSVSKETINIKHLVNSRKEKIFDAEACLRFVCFQTAWGDLYI